MKTAELIPEGRPSRTTKAIRTAHDGYVDGAIGSFRWYRRGFLQRLVREPRSD